MQPRTPLKTPVKERRLAMDTLRDTVIARRADLVEAHINRICDAIEAAAAEGRVRTVHNDVPGHIFHTVFCTLHDRNPLLTVTEIDAHDSLCVCDPATGACTCDRRSIVAVLIAQV
jgi:hypothetical protein